MAKLTALPTLAAAAIDGTEFAPVVKNGVTHKAKLADLPAPQAKAEADRATAQATRAETATASVVKLLTFPIGHHADLDRITDPYVYGSGVVAGKIYYIKQFDNNVPGAGNRSYLGLGECNPDGSGDRFVSVFLQVSGPQTGLKFVVAPPFGGSNISLAAMVDYGDAAYIFPTPLTRLTAALPAHRVRSKSQTAYLVDVADGVPAPAADTTYLVDDQRNKAFTARVHGTEVRSVQRPTAGHNAFIVNGQSLGAGNETWPALSIANRLGNMQLGGNVLPNALGFDTFSQFGTVTLRPLVAQTVSGGSQLDAAGEAALAPGAQHWGEPPNHGFVNGAKARLNRQLVAENDPRVFVTANVATPGQPIGALKKNHNIGGIEYYGKFTSVLTKLGTAIGPGSWVVAGLVWMQGEFDQNTTYGSTNATKATYQAAFATLVADMQTDARTATGQALPPALLTYQPAPSGVADADANGVPGQHVGMALLDHSLADPTVFLAGPIYPVTDKGTHLDSNGSRWFGHMLAKVWDHVVLKGKDWQPLRPIAIKRGGARFILVHYHVPAGPLVFGTPYKQNAAFTPVNRGFYVKDTTGAVPITSVTIVSDTIIRIDLGRDMAAADADVRLWYAGAQTEGFGAVRDSDAATATDVYEYVPTRGMYASADVAALKGKPYPLQNWSVGFSYVLGHEER